MAHFKPISLVYKALTGANKSHSEKYPLEICFAEIDEFLDFLVIDADVAYNVLFEIPSFRINFGSAICLPSMHQLSPTRRSGTIPVDNDHFLET